MPGPFPAPGLQQPPRESNEREEARAVVCAPSRSEVPLFLVCMTEMKLVNFLTLLKWQIRARFCCFSAASSSRAVFYSTNRTYSRGELDSAAHTTDLRNANGPLKVPVNSTVLQGQTGLLLLGDNARSATVLSRVEA